MKLQNWINCYFFVALILKVKSTAEGGPKANLTGLQERVEKLIETVLTAIQEYYQHSEKEYKCLPDKYTDELMNVLKDGIDCVEENHKQYQEGRIDLQEHRKEFLKCFAKAKNAVSYVLQKLDPADNNCSSEIVEKTFQINVTTSYTKTFNLNIQNGVRVWYNKTIQVTRHEDPCRNYPDVFSFDDKPGRRQEVTTKRTSGILHHNRGAGNGYRRWGGQDSVTDEVITQGNLRAMHDVKVSTPDADRLRHEPRNETAYAYFESLQSGENTRIRREQREEPEVLRKIRNSVLKERQLEVTA